MKGIININDIHKSGSENRPLIQQNVNVWLLVSIGLGAVMAFVVFGFILIGKIKAQMKTSVEA